MPPKTPPDIFAILARQHAVDLPEQAREDIRALVEYIEDLRLDVQREKTWNECDRERQETQRRALDARFRVALEGTGLHPANYGAIPGVMEILVRRLKKAEQAISDFTKLHAHLHEQGNGLLAAPNWFVIWVAQGHTEAHKLGTYGEAKAFYETIKNTWSEAYLARDTGV